MQILDKELERLLTVSGVSQVKLAQIKDSYLENRGARDVLALLLPYGITAKKALRFYREYGKAAVEVVKEQPYRLCEIAGIGFLTADKIAMSVGFDELSPERVDEGILYTLRDAETKGHLCLESEKLFKDCLKLLNTKALTEKMVRVRAGNGDIGYIKEISTFGEDTIVQIDFGDNRIQKYNSEELEILDWGYATTIHKSQGDEYNTVILNLQLAHAIMLTRPLLYTAITRGKNKVIIVGERKTLCIAINRTDTEKRGICLAK